MKMLIFLFSLIILSGVNGMLEMPFLINSDRCPVNYDARNGFCFHQQSKFQMDVQNALTTTYVRRKNGNIEPVTSHYLVWNVVASLPNDPTIKIPVVGIPIEIRPVESDQHLYAPDKNGQVTETKIHKHAKWTRYTNSEGKLALAFAIENPEKDLRLQKLSVRCGFMAESELVEVRGDTDAFQSIASISANQLYSIKPSQSKEDAAKVTESVRILISKTMDFKQRTFANIHTKVLNIKKTTEIESPLKRTLPHLHHGNELFDEDWSKIKEEVIHSVHIVQDASLKIVKAIIKTGKQVVEILVTTLKVAVKVLVSFLKVIGLTLKMVVDAVKFVIRWDQVVNTQVVLHDYLRYIRNETDVIMEEKREKILANLGFFKGGIKQKIDSVIKYVRSQNNNSGDPHFHDQIPVNANNKTTGYCFVSNMINHNADKIQILAHVGASKELDDQLKLISAHIPPANYELQEQVHQIRKELRLQGVVTFTVAAVLTLVRNILDVLDEILIFSTDVVIRLLATSIKIFYFVIMLDITIPFVSDLYNYVISNGKFELSLMSLSTLVPAIAYTYGFMFTNNGKAPFPDSKNIPKIDKEPSTSLSLITPTSMNEAKTSALVEIETQTSLVSLTARGIATGVIVSTLVSLIILVVIINAVLAIFTVLASLAWSLPVTTVLFLLIFLVLIR